MANSKRNTSERSLPEHLRERHFNHNGPTNVEYDVVRMQRWALITQSLFWTPPHHDGSGLGTWMQVTSGMKAWSYIRPKAFAGATDSASAAYLELAAASSLPELPSAPDIFAGKCTVHNLFLTPGTLL